jgi:hypothetical protein
MFCPECGAEFKDEITTCADCDVELTAEAPSEVELEPYVTVLETSDLSAIPVIKSALRAAGIPFRTRGEGLMNLFPSEALGAPVHSSAGEVVIRVPEPRSEEAHALLEGDATLEEDALVDDDADNVTEPTQ